MGFRVSRPGKARPYRARNSSSSPTIASWIALISCFTVSPSSGVPGAAAYASSNRAGELDSLWFLSGEHGRISHAEQTHELIPVGEALKTPPPAQRPFTRASLEENPEHIAYQLGGMVFFVLTSATFWLLVYGQLSVARLVSCVASCLGFYVVVTLLWISAVCGVCRLVIGIPLTHPVVARINYPAALILFMWALWRTWKCLGITVNP